MSTDHALAKSMLRAAALRRRDMLPLDDRAAASRGAARRACALPLADDLKGLTLSGYHAIRSEIDPFPLMELAASRGASLALPVTTPDGLVFRAWTLGAPLCPAGFGTFGPPPSAPACRPDILVVPLAAFDRRLHRIGYGKGHYDRALEALRADGHGPLTVGLAFAAQEVDAVPDEPHDIPLDFIITERELLAAGCISARGPAAIPGEAWSGKYS